MSVCYLGLYLQCSIVGNLYLCTFFLIFVTKQKPVPAVWHGRHCQVVSFAGEKSHPLLGAHATSRHLRYCSIKFIYVYLIAYDTRLLVRKIYVCRFVRIQNMFSKSFMVSATLLC